MDVDEAAVSLMCTNTQAGGDRRAKLGAWDSLIRALAKRLAAFAAQALKA